MSGSRRSCQARCSFSRRRYDDRGRGGQPWRAAVTSLALGLITLRGTKVLPALEIVIGPTLGSPLGRMSKLPVMPFLTLAWATPEITPEREAEVVRALRTTSAAWPA